MAFIHIPQEFLCPFKQFFPVTFRRAVLPGRFRRAFGKLPRRVRLSAFTGSYALPDRGADRFIIKPVDLYGAFSLLLQDRDGNIAVKQGPHQ